MWCVYEQVLYHLLGFYGQLDGQFHILGMKRTKGVKHKSKHGVQRLYWLVFQLMGPVSLETFGPKKFARPPVARLRLPSLQGYCTVQGYTAGEATPIWGGVPPFFPLPRLDHSREWLSTSCTNESIHTLWCSV